MRKILFLAFTLLAVSASVFAQPPFNTKKHKKTNIQIILAKGLDIVSHDFFRAFFDPRLIKQGTIYECRTGLSEDQLVVTVRKEPNRQYSLTVEVEGAPDLFGLGVGFRSLEETNLLKAGVNLDENDPNLGKINYSWDIEAQITRTQIIAWSNKELGFEDHALACSLKPDPYPFHQ